jgi:hypothetical protein
VNNYIKNIILTFCVALYFIVAFSGQIGFAPTTTTFAPTTNICYLETATKTESRTQEPQCVPAKPRPSVLKVEIQIGTIVPPHQFPIIQQFVLIRSSSPYRLSPQVSYVRYLPRDPPKA